MRLGWTTGKYPTTYYAVKTVRVDEKNKTLIIKRFGADSSLRTYDLKKLDDKMDFDKVFYKSR